MLRRGSSASSMLVKPARTASQRRPIGIACEPIERRLLMCNLHDGVLPAAPEFDWAVEQTEAARIAARGGPDGGPEAVSIVWSNRGQASDNFSATFGTMATQAREVVDAALNDWERVITSWNRADGTTTLQINISISGTGYGGAGSPSGTAPADGKPRTGSFTLAAGRPDLFPNANDSNGWYLDPTPTDGAEFTTVVNAFAGQGSGLGSDFYSVVVAELTHVLGLITDKNNNGGSWNGYLLENSGYLTNTNIVDNAEGGGSFGRFWVFDGPSVDHLMTSYNSGDQTSASWGNIVHSAGIRPTALNFNGKSYQGSEDAGNASYSGNERTMPSWVMANILKDAYGYTIVQPQQFGTFYANLNRDTGVLTLRGGDFHESGAVTNDKFYVTASGSEIIVGVDVPADIAGTYAFSGGGDFPTWSSTFNTSEVSQIVIQADDGDDDIFVYGVPSGVTVVVNAGNGNDFIQVGDGDVDDINSGVQGNVTVNGGAGTDDLSFFDFLDDIGNDTYTITASTVRKTASSTSATVTYNNADVETLSVAGNPQNNTFLVNSTSVNVAYSLNGFGGDDTFNIGNGDFDTLIDGAITVAGGAGNDLIVIDDTSDTVNDAYQIAGNRFEKTSLGTGSVVASSSTETMQIQGSNNNNTWSVPQLSSFLDLVINAGAGNDSFSGFFNNNFDSNVQSSITFNAGGGSDSITFNDQGSAGLTYNLTSTSINKGGAGVLNYLSTESFTLNCNALDNTINVNGSALLTTYRLNGNSGADTFNVVSSSTNGVIVHGGGGLDNVAVNSDESLTATVHFEQDQDLNQLYLYEGAIVNVVPDGDIGLDVASNGFLRGILNLNNNFMVSATSTSFLLDRLIRGYNGGAWNGAPAGGAAGVVRSATAAGSALADGLGYAQVGAAAGQLDIANYRGINVSAGKTIISYTLYGDNNLDRTVGIGDFANLAANYNLPGTNWVRGDYNFDSTTGIGDFANLAANYNQAAPAALARSGDSTEAPRVASALPNRFATTPIDPDRVWEDLPFQPI